MHKFDPKDLHKLESPERREKLPPDIIAGNIDISKGDIVADLGCGSGYFTTALSERAGHTGRVYAVDISGCMLDFLLERTQGISNIIPVLSGENDPRLEENSTDVAFMAFVLHEVSNKKVFISKVKSILKSGGRAVVIDWQKKNTEAGPPVEDRLDTSEVKELFKELGFEMIREVPHHGDIYFLIFRSV